MSFVVITNIDMTRIALVSSILDKEMRIVLQRESMSRFSESFEPALVQILTFTSFLLQEAEEEVL